MSEQGARLNTWFMALVAIGILVVIASLLLTEKVPEYAPKRFKYYYENGGTCAELFEARNDMKREGLHELVDRANDQLKTTGCYSSTSERTDQ